MFDESEDLGPVFDAAFAQSKATGKKILVEYGGDWCKWSGRMAAVLRRPKFSSFISQRFIFIRCYVGPGGTNNPDDIELPPLDAVPYFSLMDSDGRIVATQATEVFELFWFYRKSKILAFLRGWSEL